MVRTKQSRQNSNKLQWYKPKRNCIPPLQRRTLKLHIRILTPRKHTPRITKLTRRRLYKRVKIPTTPQLVLNPQSPLGAEHATPLRVDLALEVERARLVGDVPRRDDEPEGDPEEERVACEEAAVVEQDSGPPQKGGEYADGSGDRREDELGAVPDADNVGVCPDVEPGEEAEDERD